MTQRQNGYLEVTKFIISLIVGVIIASVGYLITDKLEGIEQSIQELNKKINYQMVINKGNEKDVEQLFKEVKEHEIRLQELERE
jgi:uncharacterized membrane protein (DUF106 family)